MHFFVRENVDAILTILTSLHFRQLVEEVRALHKQCGVDDKGTKVDLVMRLLVKMSNKVTYAARCFRKCGLSLWSE